MKDNSTEDFCEYEGKCMKVCDCEKCKLNFQKDKFEYKLITTLLVLAMVFVAGVTAMWCLL